MVITIILILILATISIQALTGTGLFENAKRAKLEYKRGQVQEWLTLKLLEEQQEGYDKTEMQILEATRENIDESQDEILPVGKIDNIGEIYTEEDGEKVDPYFYVTVDKDVYKVDIKGASFIGEQGKFPPTIKIVSVTNTSNSITVQVKTGRNDGGKVQYWIKNETDNDYKQITELEENTYTYKDLTQGVKYSIKVVAVAPNKKTAEATAEQITGSVINLTEADLDFTYEPSANWTNSDVKVTVKPKIDIGNYKIRTKKDDGNWETKDNQIFSANGTMYVVLWDGTNYGGSAATKIGNIDKIAPTISTALNSTSQTTNSITLSIGATDTLSGLGKIEWYYGTTNNPTTLGATTSITELNESVKGPTTEQTKAQTISGLSAGTTYYFKAVVYDVVENPVSSAVISVKTKEPLHKIGDEVSVREEKFYVLNWNDDSDTALLISKFNLNKEGTAQQNAAYTETASSFSLTNYWSSSFNSSPFDLNNFIGYIAKDAIGKTKTYGTSIEAVSSRLLSYEEADTLKSKASSNTKIDTMLWGKANSADGHLNYWLGSAFDTGIVWAINGGTGDFRKQLLFLLHVLRGATSYNNLKI